MMLDFEPVAHRYTWNQRHIPSVTQCLEQLFDWSQVPPAVLERKRQIGVAVHSMIHMELSGVGVDEASIDPACVPYFDAWRRFRDECSFEPVLIEYRVWNDELCDKRYGELLHTDSDDLQGFYAGTLDEWGELQGYPALVDWKTSMALNVEAVGAQTAAYLKALVRMGFGSLHDRRFALKLGGDGRYRLEPYRRIDEDWSRFVQHLRGWWGNQQ